jgi:hypothetical protein
MKKLLLPSLGLIASLILSQHTLALTFKTGEVIGPDGKSYVGMSPQNKARMMDNTEPGEIKSGVMNKHFYLVYNNQLAIVPMTELRDKTTAERMTRIKQAITIASGVQLSNTGQSPTLSTHMDGDINNATQEVAHSLDSEIQEVNDHLESDLEHDLNDALGHDFENEINDHLESELEHEINDALGHDFENEINDHLENDLKHELNDALGHDFENEINDHLENDHTFDRVDNDDRNESHDDNNSHDSHDSNDDHDDDD